MNGSALAGMPTGMATRATFSAGSRTAARSPRIASFVYERDVREVMAHLRDAVGCRWHRLCRLQPGFTGELNPAATTTLNNVESEN